MLHWICMYESFTLKLLKNDVDFKADSYRFEDRKRKFKEI